MTGPENRASFLSRLEPFLSPRDMFEVEWGYQTAKGGHQYQVRSELDELGNPVRYFEHCRRVAIILIDEVKVVRTEMVIAALCHDAFEDTRYIRPALFEHKFGSDTTTLVKVLSKCPPEGYIDRFMMCTDWRCFMLKGCDRLDNQRSLGSCSVEKRTKQVKETREKYYPLFERMVNLTPDEYKPRAQWLRDAVMKETERQATLLEVHV